MGLVSQFAIYFIFWWLTLFLVLPFGVRSQIEAGEVVHGSEGGAPAHPQIGKKMLITTLLSAVFYGAFYYAFTTGIIDFHRMAQ
jgi:predicted secreted protein